MPDISRDTPRLALRCPARILAASLLAVTAMAVAAPAPAAPATPFGEAPLAGTGARDLAASLQLPALHDQAGGALAAAVAPLQMGRRARALGLDARSALAAWQAADTTLAVAEQRLAATPPTRMTPFSGTRASQLNALLRDPAIGAVRVASPSIEIDEAIVVRRQGFWLDLGPAELRAGATGPVFLLRVERSAAVTVVGGAFLAGRWGALVAGSTDVTLRGGRYAGLGRGGIALTDAPRALVASSSLSGIGGAAVLVHGQTVGAALLRNQISANTGHSNWQAGVVLSDRRAAVAATPLNLVNAEGHVEVQPIHTRLQPPRGTLLAYNRIAGNASSGVYVDGAVGSVMFQNVVEGNAKEGICLDNGAAANVVAMNLVRANGKRWGKSDAELQRDFVGAYGRLADGSSPAKLPGISIDNALYNVVYANQIDRNFGGGVKLVRTAFFNTVGLNLVTDNNEGANARFHFFAIELGAAPADAPAADLDFTPSRGNLVFGNVLRGKHYAGVFYGPGSTDNETFENSVFGASAWAFEQARPQRNPSRNNLSDLASRNIGSGLEAGLLELARPRND